jgi:hypothetical protein
MNTLSTTSLSFDKDWNELGIYHGKKVFHSLPNWEDILNILNAFIRDKENNIALPVDNDFEVVYKDLLAIKKVKYPYTDSMAHVIESDATFFFSLFFDKDRLGQILSQELEKEMKELDKTLDIKTEYGSLKISLSDKFVPYETHSWDTSILQLAGTTNWMLRNKDINFEELYVLEPGDFLLFRKGIEHELSSEKPRASLVGQFEWVKDNE